MRIKIHCWDFAPQPSDEIVFEKSTDYACPFWRWGIDSSLDVPGNGMQQQRFQHRCTRNTGNTKKDRCLIVPQCKALAPTWLLLRDDESCLSFSKKPKKRYVRCLGMLWTRKNSESLLSFLLYERNSLRIDQSKLEVAKPEPVENH